MVIVKKFYLHRISHEGNSSYSLLDKGYLSLGWSMFADTDIMDAARESGYPRFNPITEEYGEGKNRSRWCMWYFAQMEVGDKVVVPLYGGKFSVYEVCERAKSIVNLEDEIAEFNGAWNNHRIKWKDHRLFDTGENLRIDIGFYCTVKPVVTNVPRDYVTGKLISRMKIRTTTVDISDLKNEVEIAINVGKTNKAVSLYGQSIDELAGKLKEQIVDVLDADKFEKLIKWYIEKCGAEYSKIPAKNDPEKPSDADADVIAEFRRLKHIIYIQAKHHNGETSDWAVRQINEYFAQKEKEELDSDYSYAKWVISTCDSFSNEAVDLAKEYGVRLINGEEFATMLLDIGLYDIDAAFDKK